MGHESQLCREGLLLLRILCNASMQLQGSPSVLDTRIQKYAPIKVVLGTWRGDDLFCALAAALGQRQRPPRLQHAARAHATHNREDLQGRIQSRSKAAVPGNAHSCGTPS